MKIKKGSLLTILLAALCAVAVALGVSLMLPKQEKINASATTVNNAVPEITGETPKDLNGTGIDGSKSDNTNIRFIETSQSTNHGSGVVEFAVKLDVPAYTEYKVDYTLTIVIFVGSSASTAKSTANIYLSRYADSSYSEQKGTTVSAGVSLAGLNQTGSNPYNLNNLIFTNNTATKQPYKVYFKLEFNVVAKSGSSQIRSDTTLTDYTITATDLATPETSDTTEYDYDKKEHTVNFVYAEVQDPKTDVDDEKHTYTTGYKNVEVTVDAKDFDGKTISKSDYTLVNNGTDPTEPKGSGSITATKAGKYTVKFKIKDTAKSNGIKWDDGTTAGTDKDQEITLTIKKIDPTINPKIGDGPWYTNKDLYKDVKIERTEGDTEGKLDWKENQTLITGTNNYAWEFTPEDTRNYNSPKTGTLSITAESLKITAIKAEFEQDGSVFYTSDSLDSLKANLVVKKKYNDSNKEEVITDPSLYTLSVPDNKLTAGTVTVTVKYKSSLDEKPAKKEFTTTFEVEITAVELESISAEFTPGENKIYLSNSLDDLKQYLTVTGTYSDGNKGELKKEEYTLSTPSGALSTGTVTVTVVSTEDGTIKDTFEVEVLPDIKPVDLSIPEAGDLTYSGEEFDIINELKKLTSEQVIKYLDVSGATSGRNAGEYVVKFTIRSEFIGNVNWEGHTATLTKYALSSKGVTAAEISEDGRTATLTWKILKAKVAATWDEEECVWVPVISGTLAETTEPDFLTQTYTNSDGKAFTNRSKLAGGRTYQVTAAISPKYANNFELDDSTQTLINSGSETYTYTPEYVPSLWEKIVAFLKANWLWLVIAIAALILLIVIIVVAVKRHKTKEERAEKKALEKERKEEEKRRREEERRRQEEERRRKEEELAEEKRRREEERKLQQERLEEERRLQKEKLEHERELERIKAQAAAGAGMAGMAGLAIAQPQQQQAMPTPQPVQQVVDNSSNELLREMTRQMAELRADNKATQAQLQAMQNNQQNQPQPMQMPMYQQQPMYPQYPMMPQMPNYGNDLAMARMEAQLNAMQAEQRARYDAEQRIELAAMRAESHVDRDSRHSVDLAAMREHINGYNYNRVPDYSQPQLPYNQSNNMDMMGALVAATLKNMANGELAVSQSAPELPQKSGQNGPSAKYPSDAVITTTTTVDTTKNKPIRRDENFDVDGFYDSMD